MRLVRDSAFSVGTGGGGDEALSKRVAWVARVACRSMESERYDEEDAGLEVSASCLGLGGVCGLTLELDFDVFLEAVLELVFAFGTGVEKASPLPGYIGCVVFCGAALYLAYRANEVIKDPDGAGDVGAISCDNG